MSSSIRLSRLVSAVGCPLSVLLGILFFLPWVNLNCTMGQIGSSSGMQLAAGKMKESEGFAKQQAQAKEGETKPGPNLDLDEAINARPWFFAGLVLPTIILWVSLSGMSVSAPRGRVGSVLALAGILGIVLTISASRIDFSDELCSAQQQAQSQAMAHSDPNAGLVGAFAETMFDAMNKQVKEQLSTEGTGVLWTSLVLYCMAAALGLKTLLLPKFYGDSVVIILRDTEPPASSIGQTPCTEPDAHAKT